MSRFTAAHHAKHRAHMAAQFDTAMAANPEVLELYRRRRIRRHLRWIRSATEGQKPPRHLKGASA